jgi:hypothetical protein
VIDLFSNLELDKLSFWLGFIAGIIFIWLIRNLWRYLPRALQYTKQKYLDTREELSSNAELKYRNEMLNFLQKQHITSTMFSLDEISLPPRLMAPPDLLNEEEGSQPDNIINLTIPYLPDWPEMAAKYKAPTISLIDALKNGANLILMGQPGSGRTFALAYLASSLLRKEIELNELINFLPLFFHAQEIPPPSADSSSLEDLVEIISRSITSPNRVLSPHSINI